LFFLSSEDFQINTVASGVLGREVFIWDLEAAMVPVARAQNEASEDGSYADGSYTSGWLSVILSFFVLLLSSVFVFSSLHICLWCIVL